MKENRRKIFMRKFIRNLLKKNGLKINKSAKKIYHIVSIYKSKWIKIMINIGNNMMKIFNKIMT